MNLDTHLRLIIHDEAVAQTDGEERFAERRRIALLEHDLALRPVLIRTLLHLGCVVSTKREIEQMIEALQTAPIDGAVLALAGNLSCLPALQSANAQQVPIVVLMDVPVESQLQHQFPAIHYLHKPFDMRELLVCLGLPEKATVLPSR